MRGKMLFAFVCFWAVLILYKAIGWSLTWKKSGKVRKFRVVREKSGKCRRKLY